MTLSRVKVPGESCTLSRACQALLTPKVSGYRGTSVGLAWHKCRGVSSNGAGLRAFPSHSPVGRHFAPGVARGITAPQRGANTAPKRRGLRPPGPPWAAPPAPCRAFGTLGRHPRYGWPARRGAGYRAKERSIRPWGEAPEVGAPKARKPRVSRWATACGCPRATPEGARGGAKAPAQVFGYRGEAPLAWGWRSRPQSPAGLTSLRQQGIVSTPLP